MLSSKANFKKTIESPTPQLHLFYQRSHPQCNKPRSNLVCLFSYGIYADVVLVTAMKYLNVQYRVCLFIHEIPMPCDKTTTAEMELFTHALLYTDSMGKVLVDSSCDLHHYYDIYHDRKGMMSKYSYTTLQSINHTWRRHWVCLLYLFIY